MERTAQDATSTPTAPPTQTPTPRMPPGPLFKAVNPVLRWLLRSPFHGGISKSLALLTFTGRKTGKRYTTPVGYHRVDGKIIVFTDSGWWRNLPTGATATLLIAGREVPVRAEAVRDTDAMLRVYQRIQASGNEATAKRMRTIFGLDQNRPPTDADVRAALETPRRPGHPWRMLQFSPLPESG